MLNAKIHTANGLPNWSLDKIDDLLSITTITGIDRNFLLALQV